MAAVLPLRMVRLIMCLTLSELFRSVVTNPCSFGSAWFFTGPGLAPGLAGRHQQVFMLLADSVCDPDGFRHSR